MTVQIAEVILMTRSHRQPATIHGTAATHCGAPAIAGREFIAQATVADCRCSLHALPTAAAAATATADAAALAACARFSRRCQVAAASALIAACSLAWVLLALTLNALLLRLLCLFLSYCVNILAESSVRSQRVQ